MAERDRDLWRDRIIERTVGLVVDIHLDTGLGVEDVGAVVAAAAIGLTENCGVVERRVRAHHAMRRYYAGEPVEVNDG